MRDFPSCFGESGVQIADYSSSSSSSSPSTSVSHRSVTCIYRARLGAATCLVTATWTRSMVMGAPSLALALSDPLLGRPLCSPLLLKPSLFSKHRGSRSIRLLPSSTLDLLWDLSSPTFFSPSSPEPLSGFYVALLLDLKPVLLLGELPSLHRPPAPLLARRDHLTGRGHYSTRAHLAGGIRDLAVDCDASAGDPRLEIRVDGKRVVQVGSLRWKFRGNQSIVVAGAPVEVFWDVHAWLFPGGAPGSAVFVFAERPEEDAREWAEVPPWAEGGAFSLVLHAWRE